MNREYNLAMAMIKFKQSWKELTDASKQVDTDLTEGYPFYLLDFEEITPAVQQWCNIHASRIISQTPDQITNPTCLRCAYVFKGIDKDGRCKGQNSGVDCGSYPIVPYNRNIVISALDNMQPGNRSAIEKLDDTNVLLAYIDITNRLEEQANERGSNA